MEIVRCVRRTGLDCTCRAAVGEWERDSDGGSATGPRARGSGVTAVLAGDVTHKEEAEAGPLDAGHGAAGGSVKAFEDLFELAGFEAYPGVGDGEGDGSVVDDRQAAADVNAFGRVLDGVVEDVDDGGAEVFGDAHRVEADGTRNGLEDDAAGGEMVALQGDGDAIFDEGPEVDDGAVLLAVALAKLPGFEDLLDGGEEPVGVGEHDLVELLFLFFRCCPALEGLEVEADAGDGGLELVSDGVEEGVLPLVATDLADEEDGVENDAGDEGHEEDDAEDGEGEGALVEEDPGALGDGETNEENAEGDEEGDGSAASGDVHGLVEV